MKKTNDLEVVEPVVFVTVNSTKEELIKAYPELILNENLDQKITKKNLISELKKEFPKVKFSVRKDYYNSYIISWFESVTIEEVEKVTNKFVSFENDFTGDFRDYAPSNFNRIFGGFKYISTIREIGEIKNILLDQLSDLMGDEQKNYPNDVSDILYRLLRKSSFPVGAKITGVKLKDSVSVGTNEDSFTIIFE